MATIQASIQLKDGMSPALRVIEQTLGAVIDRFDRLQHSLDRALNPTVVNATNQALNTTQSHINNVEQETNQAASAQQRFYASVEKSLQAIYNQVTNQVRLTDAIRKTPPAIQQEAAAQETVNTAINGGTAAQEKFNNTVKSGGGIVSGLVSKMGMLLSAYTGIYAVGGIVKTADQLQMTKARLDLMNDGLQTTEQLQEKIFQAAQRSRGEYAATADAVAKLGLRAGSIFKNNDETIQFTETLNKMFVIAGASTAEMNSATLQLTQALGSGVLRGEEFNAVFEAAPNVMQAVADHIGKPIGALRGLAKEGEITAQMVKEAIFASTESVNEQFEKMPVTFAQAWQSMKNNILDAAQPILQVLSDITSSERFQKFADGVGSAIGRVTQFFQNVSTVVMPILGGIFDMVAKIGNFFSDHWSIIAPLVWGVVIAMTAYKTVTMAVATWTAIVSAATAIKNTVMGIAAARTALLTGATYAQVAAQYGLNTAIYACPITWIILAIIALVAVIYAAVAAVNHFAGTSYSATGFICAAFMGMYTSIYNNIASLWNTFASFAEFLCNLFIDPTYACKKLFVDLATVVLNIISSMSSGWVEHARGVVEVMTSAINGVLSAYNKFADSWLGQKLGINSVQLKSTDDVIAGLTGFNAKINAAKAGLQSWLGKAPANAISIPRMELKNYAEQVANGYSWGADKATMVENFMNGADFTGADKIKELEGLMEKYGVNNQPASGNGTNPAATGGSGGSGGAGDIADALSESPALDSLAKSTDGLADEVANLSKTISVSDEEMNTIRQLATREILNQVTRNSINIQMTNNNQIKDSMDVQAVAKELARQVQQEIEASSEGIRR